MIGGHIESWMEADHVDIKFITMIFGALIVAAATQGGSNRIRVMVDG
jgi:hypothetical protein